MILDNFEQVASHAESTLGSWLEQAPEARFLVTSRGLLGIAGESALDLAPLDPDEGARLFRERIGAIGMDQQLGAADEAAISGLIEMLDRLPLAIELAARVPRSCLRSRCFNAWVNGSSFYGVARPSRPASDVEGDARLVLGLVVCRSYRVCRSPPFSKVAT